MSDVDRLKRARRDASKRSDNSKTKGTRKAPKVNEGPAVRNTTVKTSETTAQNANDKSANDSAKSKKVPEIVPPVVRDGNEQQIEVPNYLVRERVTRREARDRTIHFQRSFLVYCWLSLIGLSIVGAIFALVSESGLKSTLFLVFAWVLITERDTICRPQIRRTALSDIVFAKLRERFSKSRPNR